ILKLIDLSLLANLVLIVIFSGYESFVSRIESDPGERPAWMGKIDFAGLKVKLMGSLAAISGIYLLEALLNLDPSDWRGLVWKLAIHVTFVVSGVLFAFTEHVEAASHRESAQEARN
ncbi:MAG TPA: YqhA family protein, partial [Nevskiaceae bacterium]|nr:YqhA family protein [Nevskiaceae bacterium]